MPTITTRDGTAIYYKDWVSGQPIVFSHGWPLSADAWEDQMVFLGAHGYRCIAHDRRGHGRSSQPWDGNDMDMYADDLATLVEPLGLTNAVHVGNLTHSLLDLIDDSSERARIEYKFCLALLTPLIAAKGYTAPELERIFERALLLSEEIGDTEEIFPAWMDSATRIRSS